MTKHPSLTQLATEMRAINVSFQVIMNKTATYAFVAYGDTPEKAEAHAMWSRNGWDIILSKDGFAVRLESLT